MTVERYNNQEFENTLRASAKSDFPGPTKALITELFLRVQALESPSPEDRLSVLNEIVAGMEGDLDELGEKPDKVDLRDRLRSVATAVRDLAQYLADSEKK